MGKQIPLVSYLVLDDGEPHLAAETCVSCGAKYFGRRNACASCGGREFTTTAVASTGVVTSFTIVQRAPKGVKAPFVSAVVALDDGTSVKGNVVDVEPDPEHVHLGMKVKLVTYPAGTDSAGTEAVAFGFAPVS
jgi:uncharacterized OB-fold protein